MDAEVSFALRWAETMRQAEEDTKVAEMQCWGEPLMRGLRAYNEDTYSEAVVQTLTLVLANTSIETKWYPTILRWRSYVYVQAGQYTEALTDMSRVIELNPTDPLNIANRGLIYLCMRRYDEGLEDLRRLCELEIETLRYCLNQLRPRWWDPLSEMKDKIRELKDIQKLFHVAFSENQ